MSRIVGALLVSLVLTLPVAEAPARGWLGQRGQTSYYYPVYPVTWAMPVTYAPAPPCPAPPAIPYQAPAPQPYAQQAQPVPANPSGQPLVPRTNEPPLSTRKPMITESRSYYDSFGVVGGQRSVDGLSPVGFWNLSERDVTLSVAERIVVVPRGRSVKLQLPRSFAWRIDNRELQNETIPAHESALEIVIRH